MHEGRAGIKVITSLPIEHACLDACACRRPGGPKDSACGRVGCHEAGQRDRQDESKNDSGQSHPGKQFSILLTFPTMFIHQAQRVRMGGRGFLKRGVGSLNSTQHDIACLVQGFQTVSNTLLDSLTDQLALALGVGLILCGKGRDPRFG